MINSTLSSGGDGEENVVFQHFTAHERSGSITTFENGTSGFGERKEVEGTSHGTQDIAVKKTKVQLNGSEDGTVALLVQGQL